MELRDLKQQVLRIYNQVNQEMYEIGVKRLRVDIIGSKIIILADHGRIRGLKSLDEKNRFVSRMADIALLDENKERLKQHLEQELSLKVKCVLKDYDPYQELAATVIVLFDPLTND